MDTKVRITDFRTFGKRVDFEVTDDFHGTTTHYHTDRDGEGLWEGDDYTKQKLGALDFSLKQKTRAGVQRVLNRYFND